MVTLADELARGPKLEPKTEIIPGHIDARSRSFDPANLAWAKALRAKGKSYEEIGKTIGVSQGTAWLWINRNGKK